MARLHCTVLKYFSVLNWNSCVRMKLVNAWFFFHELYILKKFSTTIFHSRKSIVNMMQIIFRQINNGRHMNYLKMCVKFWCEWFTTELWRLRVGLKFDLNLLIPFHVLLSLDAVFMLWTKDCVYLFVVNYFIFANLLFISS